MSEKEHVTVQRDEISQRKRDGGMFQEARAVSAICVKDLKAGDTILQFFQLKSRDARKTRSGQDYLDLGLSDATGVLSAKMWADAIRKWGQDFSPGDFVKVEGRIETYRDRCQLVVEKIRRCDPAEVVDPESLIRSTPYDPELLFKELRATADSLTPSELAELVVTILDRHAEAMKTFPAAQMIHHAYRGGLIEHVMAVLRKIEAIVQIETGINRSIALAGAILHDIGKLRELDPRGSGRTPEGRLIGHVILGLTLVRETALEMGFLDRPWLREVEHIILSHHGETEFGAPVKPLTREALLVHHIDNLDAKLKIIDEALQSADSDGFTPYNKWLAGRAYAGSLSQSEEDNDDGN
jgi:3'-5' exoribonuclease